MSYPKSPTLHARRPSDDDCCFCHDCDTLLVESCKLEVLNAFYFVAKLKHRMYYETLLQAVTRIWYVLRKRWSIWRTQSLCLLFTFPMRNADLQLARHASVAKFPSCTKCR